MLILWNFITIVAYFFNGYLGFLLSILFIFHRLFFVKEKFNEKIIDLLIFSLPMEFIGILGMNMNHALSLYNILLFFLILIFLRNGVKMKNIILIFIYFFCILISNLSANYFISNFVEIFQLFIMILPIYLYFNVDKKALSIDDIESKILMYANICVSTSLAMLIQYILYNYLGTSVGFFNFGAGRVSYFCLFRGASVLPIFMGLGFIILLIRILENKNIKNNINNLLKLLIIFSAMVLNTSRSALLVLIICSFFLAVKNIKKINFKTIMLYMLVATISYYGINYITSMRSNLSGFLDDNGRFSTYIDGVNLWLSNFKTMLIGTGFYGDYWIGKIKPHNFIFQSLSQCGLIPTSILLYWLYKLYLFNKKNKYRIIIIFVVLSSMLITDFYANAFVTIIFILFNEFGKKKGGVFDEN